MLREQYTGTGNVVLIAGGGRVFTDLAARFVRSERDLEDMIATPYSREIVRTILESNHRGVLEFDYFIFGVEGYSRVTESQLVRKRHASYIVKSGRAELGGRREFHVVYPERIARFAARIKMPDGSEMELSGRDLAEITRQWYENGVQAGLPEEQLRYLKPQATAFKALVGMNAHALLDWFSIRCCKNAQEEIRDLAWKMLRLCKETAPDLFETAGPNCYQLGYCPENRYQNRECQGKIPTKNEALKILAAHRKKAENGA